MKNLVNSSVYLNKIRINSKTKKAKETEIEKLTCVSNSNCGSVSKR